MSALTFEPAPAMVTSGDVRCGVEQFSLRATFVRNRGPILLAYALFTVENLMLLALPIGLGRAIDGLLADSYSGLALFVSLHLAHLIASTLRRVYDTRLYSRTYADLAARLVVRQRTRSVPVSMVAARCVLSREVVEFFERHVPLLLQCIYAVFGSVVLLATRDLTLAALCLGLALPAWLLYRGYARAMLRLNAELHDELEREVAVIEGGRPDEARLHFGRVAGWRVRLSDREALNFGMMELFVLLLLAATLVRACMPVSVSAGEVVAAFRYVMLFVRGLDGVPALVEQLGRVHDIGRRLRAA